MIESVQARLQEIEWEEWEYYNPRHTDGAAISSAVLQLFSDNPHAVEPAIHKLENILCHQYILVRWEFIPLCPLLVEAITHLAARRERSERDEKNFAQLIELFFGLTRSACPVDRFRPIRILNIDWTKIPHPAINDLPVWNEQVIEHLLRYQSVYEQFYGDKNPWVADSIELILTMLPSAGHTAERLLTTQTEPTRRAALFGAFAELNAPNKLSVLQDYYTHELHPLPRRTLASQIAYILGESTEQLICDSLQRFVLETPFDDILPIIRGIQWSSGFFEDFGIPLVVARPHLYEPVLARYIDYIKYKGSLFETNYLIAFALCVRPKRQAWSQLTACQLDALELVYQLTWLGRFPRVVALHHKWFDLPTKEPAFRAFMADLGRTDLPTRK